MSYALDHPIVESAPASERAAFIRRTYGHLAGAILAFIGLEALLLTMPGVENIVMTMIGGGRFGWLVVLAAFMGVSWLAHYWAQSATSLSTQYAGLALYVVAEAVIFLPLLFLVERFGKGGTIMSAGIMTLCVFGGLTLAALTTKKDFSFLGPILAVGGFVALGFIVASIVVGFSLGVVFAFIMVGFMSACILYETSQIKYHYRTDQHVAAALGLFASVATLFWYIIQIFMYDRE